MAFFTNLINRISVPPSEPSPERIDHKSKYRGVQIKPLGPGCCEAVRATMGSRYLSNEVPVLPLDGCDAISCKCTYELFENRRTDYRRAADMILDIATRMWPCDKRGAASAGRRSED